MSIRVVEWRDGNETLVKDFAWPEVDGGDVATELERELEQLGYESLTWFTLGGDYDAISLRVYVEKWEGKARWPYFVMLDSWTDGSWVGCATMKDLLAFCNQWAPVVRLSHETTEWQRQDDEHGDELRAKLRSQFPAGRG